MAGNPESDGLHRFSMNIPMDEYEAIKQFADDHTLPVNSVIRQFTELGLILHDADERGADIVVHEGDKERILKIIW